MTKHSWLFLLLFGITAVSSASGESSDAERVQICRDGLVSVLSFVQARPDLFPTEKPDSAHFLSVEQKETVRATWKSLMDYVLTLDSIAKNHQSFAQKKPDEQKESFFVFCAATHATYRTALDFIRTIKIDPGLTTVLNEPMPDLGLPKNSYDKYKFRFLNVARASEFAALEAVRKSYGASTVSYLQESITADAQKIWEAGRGHGTALTLKNGLQIIQKTGFGAWFPVQTQIASWMGDTKVYRPHQYLITKDQIEAFRAKLEPGDIFLERREWYLSNAGLPGFWPHAALYIGTADERRRYFNDPETRAWVKQQGIKSGNLEDLLKSKTSAAYERGLLPYEGETPSVLEAISEGVTFTSLTHSASADTLAVLRPQASKREKAQAIARAFSFQGRPYDFNFDFLTDAALVCSELIYKAYEPSKETRGVRFQLSEMLGRKLLPPNDIVQMFDSEFGTPNQQLDLVLFLDGHEQQKKALERDVTAFRESYKRPKWHVWVQ